MQVCGKGTATSCTPLQLASERSAALYPFALRTCQHPLWAPFAMHPLWAPLDTICYATVPSQQLAVLGFDVSLLALLRRVAGLHAPPARAQRDGFGAAPPRALERAARHALRGAAAAARAAARGRRHGRHHWAPARRRHPGGPRLHRQQEARGPGQSAC